MKNNIKNSIKYRLSLKASSFLNAIFICLIISVFSGCLVLVSHYQNMLNTQLSMYEDLIGRNESSFNYLINNTETLAYNQIEILDVFDDGIISSIEKKNWGFYDVLVCKTIFKNDTISKITLVGQKKNTTNTLALYTTNYDKPLKLSGSTKIFGNIKVPNGRIEQAYINGKEGNAIKLKGSILKSDGKLPKIDKHISIDVSSYKAISLHSLDKGTTITNGFDQPTKVIDLGGITTLTNMVFKGNIILVSSIPLEISNTAKLHDILVMAPSIHILSGFEGNIQIIAKELIDIGENVSLRYPSSIYMKNDSNPVSVTINKNSTLIGGIVIEGDFYNENLKRSLTIHENVTIVGNVYCYGLTQLEGTVIGSIYTDKFFLKTASSNYENVILNGTINRDSLPDNFIELPLFKNAFDKKKYAVVKEF